MHNVKLLFMIREQRELFRITMETPSHTHTCAEWSTLGKRLRDTHLAVAIKTQLKANKRPPTRGILCLSLSLYGIRAPIIDSL